MNRNHLYPLGFFGIAFGSTLFNQWILYFHVPPSMGETQKTTLIGIFLMLGFVIQGLSNPFIGIWGDRLVHPWGKRRPFVLLGVFPLGAVFFSPGWQV